MIKGWPEIEIADLPPLEAEESSLIEMHSVLNSISLLVGELNLIGQALTGNLEWMKDSLATCQVMIASLRKRDQALRCAADMGNFRVKVSREIEQALSQHPEHRHDPGILESLANIESVFEILALRAREIFARATHPEQWELFQIADIERDLRSFFASIERNSKGRYRIAFNRPRANTRDYWICLSVDTYLDSEVFVPPVFIDVIRDLMANARKYSFPGASISASLRQDKKSLSLVVEDTGRGIPESEIQAVVLFGMRGSNVNDVRTLGGGFGLTKAFCVAKQFGGRMWIASCVGKGTRIRIELPSPEEMTEKSGA